MVSRIISVALLLAMACLAIASTPQGKRERFRTSLSRFKREQVNKQKQQAGDREVKLDTLRQARLESRSYERRSGSRQLYL